MEKTSVLYPNEQLEHFRQQGDPLADKTVDQLFKEGFQLHQDAAYNNLKFNHQAIPNEFPAALKLYFNEVKSYQPNAKTIEKGSSFFQEYTSEIMLCLGLLSLPYCYAAADGAKVLGFSRRIIENPERRLMETAEFVFHVSEPDAFRPQGKGFISIAKVRLMHAAIRYHLKNSEKWDLSWGLPVNQEDMAATNLSFSLINIRGLRKLGLNISPKRAEEFILYWNEIGRLLGITDEMLPKDNQAAFILEKKITERTFRPSPEGKLLAKSLQDYVNKQELPLKFSADALMEYLLGQEVSEIIGVKSKSSRTFLLDNFTNLNSFRSMFPQDKQKAFRETKKQFHSRNTVINKDNKPFRFLNTLMD